MSYQERPEKKPLDASKGAPRSLALRIDRAASNLNPFLAVLAVGLLVLNLTLYLGIAAAHDSFVWSPPRHASSYERAGVGVGEGATTARNH